MRHIGKIWLITAVALIVSIVARRPPLMMLTGVIFAIASIVAIFTSKWFRRQGLLLGPDEFLCDTCKYDYGNACDLPDRPNARRCWRFNAALATRSARFPCEIRRRRRAVTPSTPRGRAPLGVAALLARDRGFCLTRARDEPRQAPSPTGMRTAAPPT